MTRLINLVLTGLIAALAGFAVPPAAAAEGGTLNVGHDLYRTLNPAIQSGNGTGVPGTQLFAGLVMLDAGFKAQPYLARSWDVSEDGLSYTFHLRDDALFHDGTPVTSKDVAFSLDIVKNNHPFGIAMFEAVDRVETPDAHTAVIRLSHSHPALMAALSPLLMPILPEHVYSTHPIKEHPANAEPIGSGPFRFVEQKSGEFLILEKFPQFFLEDRVHIERLIFKIFKDPQTRILALENGEVGYMPFSWIRVRDVARVEKAPNLQYTTDGYGALGPTNYLELNLREKPFDDVRVRKALAYAMDREFIVKTLLQGVARVNDSPFHHTSPFYDASAIVPYPGDLDKAQALLDEAGYPLKDGKRFSMVLDIPTFHPDSMQLVGEYLKSRFRKIGVEVELRTNPDFATWSNRVSNWGYQASMNAIWNYPDPVIGVHRAYLCDNQKKGVIWSNTEGYCNKEVDEVLAKAAVETDLGKRKQLYSRFQQILTEELPLIWTNEEPYIMIYNTELVENPPLSVWGGLAPFLDMRLK